MGVTSRLFGSDPRRRRGLLIVPRQTSGHAASFTEPGRPTLSVIIPTYNEAANLPRTLRALADAQRLIALRAE
jgi:cellulose synthase/poly-beta-1,6-N-acetylglucosamine synthase-like glycosyltransferase